MKTLTINVCGEAGVGKSVVATYIKKKLLKKGFKVDMFDNPLGSQAITKDKEIEKDSVKKALRDLPEKVNIKINTIQTRCIDKINLLVELRQPIISNKRISIYNYRIVSV